MGNDALDAVAAHARSPRTSAPCLKSQYPEGSRRNIAAHYDLGNDFFAHWLDGGMNYSAALFSSARQTLEDAQFAKLDRAIELLELSGGEAVLDIGCGWGGLAERLVERHGCRVTGITLSEEQLAFAKMRLSDRGLDRWTDIRLQDYRDTVETFDRIVSIEMLEAVGAAYWPTYFNRLHANLRPGGVAVLQVITIAEEYFESYRRRPDFIQKYVFPGGMLPTRRIIEREVAAAGLCLSSCEFFGKSYALTLSEWLRRISRWHCLQFRHKALMLGSAAHGSIIWRIAVQDLKQVFWTSGSIRSSGPEVRRQLAHRYGGAGSMLLALVADLECLDDDQPVTLLTVLLEQSMGLRRSRR